MNYNDCSRGGNFEYQVGYNRTPTQKFSALTISLLAVDVISDRRRGRFGARFTSHAMCRSTVAVLVCRPTHTVRYFRGSQQSHLAGLLVQRY